MRPLHFPLLGLFLGALSCGCSIASPAEPGEAPSLWLQDYIESAYRTGARKITIPPGIHRLAGESQGSGLCLENLRDAEIDASGATFVGTDPRKTLLVFRNCAHVTWIGGTFTRNPMAFSQGSIEAVGADRRSLDIRIANGYPADIDDPDYFGHAPKILAVFDAQSRDWIRNAPDIWFTNVQRLGPNLFRFSLANPLPTAYPIALGELAAWRGYDHENIVLDTCQDMRIVGVTVSGSGGFTIQEAQGEGRNVYENCRIIRGPAPAGADPRETPLFSSACDGFHSTAMRHGPTYDGCYVEFNDDDAFAIHGRGALVTENQGDEVTVGDISPAIAFQPGDRMRLYDERGALAEEARVIGTTPLPGYAYPATVPSELRNLSQSAARLYYEKVRLDHPVPVRFAWIAVDANLTGNGYSIRNCRAFHNRERGMLIKASDGTIEDNIIEGSTKGGIVFTPEFADWDEVDYTRNTLIRRNMVRDVGGWGETLGALNISEWRHGVPVPLPGGHRDIVVEDNVFERNDGTNIIITSALRVVFRGNQFLSPMLHENTTARGIPSDSLFWISDSQDIKIDGNRIDQPGPFLKSTITTTQTAADIRQDGTPVK